MPRVLITGLNGFVAVHTASVFLKNGWKVRGTVRSQDKIDKVKALPVFADAVAHGDIEVVILKDLIEGDYSEHLKGVDGIVHAASPWHLKGESWASYKDPAVQGTTNILEQAKKADVESVAIVSSFAAIGDFSKPPHEQAGKVYNENDWLPVTDEQAAATTGENAAELWYTASKKFAELAARDFEREKKPNFTIGVVNPPFILGPAIHFGPTATPEELANSDVSTSLLWQTFGSGKDGQIPPTPFPIYADVRNVADALYGVVTKKDKGRFPLENGAFDFQGLADIARKEYPDYAIPVGKPGEHPGEKTFRLDGSKAPRDLGFKYWTKDELVKGTVDQFIKLGALKKA